MLLGGKGYTHKNGHSVCKNDRDKTDLPAKKRPSMSATRADRSPPGRFLRPPRTVIRGKFGFIETVFLRTPTTVLRANRFFRDRFYAYALYMAEIFLKNAIDAFSMRPSNGHPVMIHAYNKSIWLGAK